MLEDWRLKTFLLCSYGFLKEIRPSEPYLTEYLVGNHTGVTEDQVYHDVYPVWTYSYLAILILVFLVTDLVKYKPVIILEGFSYILTWILLLWGHGLTQMQLMQVSYGVATSTEIAYFTYIYASVSGEWYQQVTSLTRAALLLGRFLSGVLAQSLVCLGWCDFRDLNYVSLAMVGFATLITFLLPSVKNTIYFHTSNDVSESGMIRPLGNGKIKEDPKTFRDKCSNAFRLVLRDFNDAFRKPYILKWSIWWALGMCGNFQVGNYIQPLWQEIQPAEDTGSSCDLYNGAVEAVTTLVGAGLALILGFTKFNWSIIGEPSLALISLLDALMLYLMATTDSIIMAYVGYVVFRALYQMMITVASFEIASNITQNSYGLVFGFNTFLALGFQTILTTIVADSVGFALSPRNQFQVYAGFFLVVGLVFLVTGSITLARGGVSRLREEGFWRSDQTRRQEIEHPPVGAIECPQ